MIYQPPFLDDGLGKASLFVSNQIVIASLSNYGVLSFGNQHQIASLSAYGTLSFNNQLQMASLSAYAVLSS